MAGGVNDVTIVSGILAFFVLLGFVLPFVQSEFGLNSTQNDLSDTSQITANPVTAVDVGISILNVVFWGFGVIPTWLNLFFWLLRALVIFIAIRNFIPTLGGGG